METIRVDDEIYLRWPLMADVRDIFALVDANRAYLGRWLPWVAATHTVEGGRPWIEGRLEAKAKGQGSPPLIMYQDRLVGTTGFDKIDSLNKSTEIGYGLIQELQGRGIVTRACRAVLDYAFGPLGMNRVVIRMAPGNEKSVAIPERLGFVFEGIARQALLLNGEYQDHKVYSMLASEWANRPQ